VPGEDIPSFTAHAKHSRRLIIRVTDPLDSESVTYTFSLLGFASAHRRLEANCPSHPPSQEAESQNLDSLVRVLRDIPVNKVAPSGEVFLESGVDERPEVLSGPSVEYPDLLRQAGIQGRVIVQAIIDTTGRAEPASVKVIQSPNPGFDLAAKTAVLKALFRPARVHGRAVRVLVNIPYDFKLSGRR